METPNYKKAKRSALSLIDKMAIIAPPVNVDKIIERENLQIKRVAFNQGFKDISGFLDISERAIYINCEDYYRRQNFTKAHELGHWVLHRELFANNPSKQMLLRREHKNDTPQEKEANAFASELLIPEHLFFDAFRHYSGITIDGLADLFQVSKQFMVFRINNI
jgi:Zn-dependent peptidase ImmA (M78 family)